jgi:hypothetical protein
MIYVECEKCSLMLKIMVGMRGAETYPVILAGVEMLARIGLHLQDPPLDCPILAEGTHNGR